MDRCFAKEMAAMADDYAQYSNRLRFIWIQIVQISKMCPDGT